MGKLDLSKMQGKLNSLAKGSSGGSDWNFDKLESGKNVRRILFPKGESESFYSEGYQHFKVGEKGRVVTCPKTYDEKAKCPVCELVEELKNSKDPDDKKLANDMRRTRRIFVNVINRDSDEDDDVRILPIGVTIFKGILEAICDPDYGDITDFEDGHDLTIKKSGSGMSTEYSVLPKPKSSKASDNLTEEELDEKLPDLEALFTKMSYDEIQAILDGEDIESTEDDDDEEEEEKPAKKSSTKKKVVEEDEEDEEENPYADLEIDELIELCDERDIEIQGKPTRVKMVKALLEADEEEEENETDDDDDDDVGDAIMQALKKRKNK